jgi:hypothetical protein
MRALAIAVGLLLAAGAFPAQDNLLRNAGFMSCANPGQPDYWGTGAPEYASNFYGNYHTHPDSPVKGTQSLMLRNEEGQPAWTVQSFLYRGIEPEADYTLSVYLRAAVPNTPAVLWTGTASKNVTVSDRWERYVWTLKPGPNTWGYTIRFTIPKGTLWIAAPMWVRGAEAADFALNPADAPAAAVAAQPKPQRPVPAVTLPLGGEVALSPFVDIYSGDPVKVQTQVRLSATDRALKMTFDCSQPDMAHVQIVGDRRDSGVYGGECLEVFIAPERTAGPYYHFAVNPNGVQADEEGFDPAWNANWSATTLKRADGWTAEISIPWSELPIGAKAGNTFGMNFCRHAKATSDELSEWSCTDGNFHNPARFGLVALPESVVTRHRGKYVARRPVVVTETVPPLRVLLDRSYYTTETRARLRVWCTDSRAVAARATVAARTFSGRLQPGASGRWAEIAIPVAELPVGETRVLVTIADRSGKPLGPSVADKITKLVGKPYGAKIDRFAACFLVDGKPFVPYCMGIHSLNQVDRLQDIKDHGFNTICAGFGGSPTEADLQANLPAFNRFFDACRRLGLKIIWWNGGGESYERIRDGFLRNIAAFQDNDLIIAWYILDEPEGWWESPTRQESDLPKFKEAVTQADPYRPSFFNYYAWKKGYGGYGGLVSSDVGSLDRYPIGRGPDAMQAMADITRTMASDCLPAGKPVNIWLQLYGYDDAVREATPAEQRCQTYLCLIEGARSIMYFIYKPMGRAMWESMLPLGQEIETLTPVLGAPPPARAVTVSSDLIRYALRSVEGKWYLVCANRGTTTVRATFDLSSLGLKGRAWDLFGKRDRAISGGKLTDTFAPLATRVYVMGANR